MPKDLEFKITDAKGGAAFTVRVVTRARKREIVGIQEDGALKIRLTCSPTDNSANEELVEFLAEELGVDTKQIEIVAGAKGREKLISVEGVTPELVNQVLIPPKADEPEA